MNVWVCDVDRPVIINSVNEQATGFNIGSDSRRRRKLFLNVPLLLLVQNNSDQRGFDENCIGVNQSEREINHLHPFNHHHHKHQGLDPFIRSVSKVTTALSNVCPFSYGSKKA